MTYNSNDIRNLKKMIEFIEECNINIKGDELKDKIFLHGLGAEERDIIYSLCMPFPNFCDEWRCVEKIEDAKRGGIKDTYMGQSVETLEKRRIAAINQIKKEQGNLAAQYEIVAQIYEQLDEAAFVIARNRVIRREVQAYMLLCFLDRLLKDNVPFMKILQYLDRNDMYGIRDTYLSAMRLKKDLTLTDEEMDLIERIKAEWEEKTIYDWEGNMIAGKLMKMLIDGDGEKETEE